MSNDTTLLCVTCGTQSTGVFAELLRTGWPTDCCAMPTIAVGVSADAIDVALRQIVGQIVGDPPLIAETTPAIVPPPPRKASGRISRRPV